MNFDRALFINQSEVVALSAYFRYICMKNINLFFAYVCNYHFGTQKRLDSL